MDLKFLDDDNARQESLIEFFAFLFFYLSGVFMVKSIDIRVCFDLKEINLFCYLIAGY